MYRCIVCCVSEQSFLSSEKKDHESFTDAQELKSLELVLYLYCAHIVYLDYIHFCVQEEEDCEDVEEDKVQ